MLTSMDHSWRHYWEKTIYWNKKTKG